VSWVVLALFAVLLVPAAIFVWGRPIFALYAFAVGLVLHNTVFMLLFAAGARGWQLTVAQAWKEILLAVALARVAERTFRRRQLPFRPGAADAAALVFCAVVVVYAVVPQDVLGGEAGVRAELYGMRHLLLAPLAYFLGRALAPSRSDLRRLAVLVLVVGAVTAAVGIAEEYLVSLERWRSLGAAKYFSEQLGFPRSYGPAGLPENFVFNTTEGVFRRLVSFFLSPLGSAYLFVVALCLAAAGAAGRVRRELVLGMSALTFAGLLFAFTRSAILALAGGLLVLAPTVRRVSLAGAGALTVVAALGFAAIFPSLAPRTHFFPEDIAAQRALFERPPGGNPLGSSIRLADPSVRSHLAELRRGARNVLEHPQGYGVGNSGPTARRFGVPLRAGESFYLETGVDTGLLGLTLWLAFTALVLYGLFTRARSSSSPFDRRLAAGLFAATAALSAIAVLSNVWEAPWPAYVVWSLAGAVLSAQPAASSRKHATARAAAARSAGTVASA
jgi:hypothetical protein